MLNCIWHKIRGESVVETDEYNRLLATGEYFKTHQEAAKANISGPIPKGKKHERINEKARHNLHGTSAKARDDQSESIDSGESSRVQRRNVEQRPEGSTASENLNGGIGCSVPSQVSNPEVGVTHDTGGENNK